MAGPDFVITKSTPARVRGLRLIWADRVALSVFVLLGIYWIAFIFAGNGIQSESFLTLFAMYALFPWIVMRLADFIVTGRIRY